MSNALQRWMGKNYHGKYMKGLPAFRVMIFGVLITMMVAYAAIYFTGGVLNANGGINNATLSQQYSYIVGNPGNPGGNFFASTNSLSTLLVKQTANATQPTGIFTQIGTAISGLAGFYGAITGGLNAIMYFSGSVFGLFGINVTYFEAIGTIMWVALIIIIIYTAYTAVYT